MKLLFNGFILSRIFSEYFCWHNFIKYKSFNANFKTTFCMKSCFCLVTLSVHLSVSQGLIDTSIKIEHLWFQLFFHDELFSFVMNISYILWTKRLTLKISVRLNVNH